MHCPFRILAFLLGVPPAFASPQCVPLATGQSVTATASTGRPACFTVLVQPGEPAELVAEQPGDLEILLDNFFVRVMTTIPFRDRGPRTAGSPYESRWEFLTAVNRNDRLTSARTTDDEVGASLSDLSTAELLDDPQELSTGHKRLVY